MKKVYIGEHKFGKGVFAAKDIKKGEQVFVLRGKKHCALKISMLPKGIQDHAVQIGSHTWIGTNKSLGWYINHSCSPNCGVIGLRRFFALRNIKKGEEVIFDYSTTEDSDWYMPPRCKCGSKNCRKTIGPWRELPERTKRKYLKFGIVSSWIKRKYGY